MAHILNILSIEEDELMSSYFKRMARANGFSNPKHFMQAYVWPDSTIGVKQRRAIRDDGFNVLLNFNKCLRNDVSLINFFLRTSLFPGLRPVISNADAISIVYNQQNLGRPGNLGEVMTIDFSPFMAATPTPQFSPTPTNTYEPTYTPQPETPLPTNTSTPYIP